MGKAFYVTSFCTLHVSMCVAQTMQFHFPIWKDFTFETASATTKCFETNFHERKWCKQLPSAIHVNLVQVESWKDVEERWSFQFIEKSIMFFWKLSSFWEKFFETWNHYQESEPQYLAFPVMRKAKTCFFSAVCAKFSNTILI